MKFVLVGHACWLVDTADVRILFDPLLFDPNQAGCYEVHPTRAVDVEAMSKVDVVIVSHRHIDHFDVRSLSVLPKSAAVLCPSDTLMVATLRSIGYTRVRALRAWESVRFGGTTVLATPSLNVVPELGFVVSDRDGRVWNQVDTQASRRTTARVATSLGKLHAVISPWQPLMELRFQLNEDGRFPHRAYFELLSRARLCDAEVLVPGAFGFRYARQAEWSNRLAFPVARDRFLRDLRSCLGRRPMQLHAMDPGDELEIRRGAPAMRARASPLISSLSGEEQRIAYCPVDPCADLYKARPHAPAVACGIAEEIDDLDRFIRCGINDRRSSLQTLRLWKVTYRLIVCLQDRVCVIHWDLGGSAQRVDGDCAHATATAIVSERVLRSLYRGQCSWEEAYHSGEWRFFQTVAAVSPQAYLVPRASDIEDVLRLRYPYPECYEALISGEVARWRTSDTGEVDRVERPRLEEADPELARCGPRFAADEVID